MSGRHYKLPSLAACTEKHVELPAKGQCLINALTVSDSRIVDNSEPIRKRVSGKSASVPN
jgi:hypothetical protein